MSVAFTEIAIRILFGYSKQNFIVDNLWYNVVYLYIVICQCYKHRHICKILISYGFARFCGDECSYFTGGQEFVPRMAFRGQTEDKTLENICKCTENAVNKRKEEKILQPNYSQ